VGEVKAKLDEGSNIVVVDVRSKAAYDMDHIVGSISIPLSDLFDAQGNPLSSEVISQRYSDLQRYDEIITSCE
jgi:rhodanese-related sulfurtransferase